MSNPRDFIAKAKELASRLLSERHPGRELEMVAIAGVLAAGAKVAEGLMKERAEARAALERALAICERARHGNDDCVWVEAIAAELQKAEAERKVQKHGNQD